MPPVIIHWRVLVLWFMIRSLVREDKCVLVHRLMVCPVRLLILLTKHVFFFCSWKRLEEAMFI